MSTAESSTARIESIAAGGAGVARVDGLVVFTPRTAPGDLVELTYVKRDRLGHGRLQRLVEPSPQRVAPRCRHYDGDQCGGCQLQHLEAEAQREAKRRIVADAFARIGKREVDVPPVIPSPSQWAYRNKLTLALRWRDGAWRAGMHRWDDVDRTFALAECPITHPRVVAGWRGVLHEGRLLPRAPELRGAVRLAGEQLSLVIEGGTRWPQAREFAALLEGFGAVRWIDTVGRVHDVLDRPRATESRAAESRAAESRAAERPVASFEQVNPAMAERLQGDVIALVRGFAPQTVIDAYAGAGETAVQLAASGIRVTAVELDREAATHAARRLASPSAALCARVEAVIDALLPADVVILNPPRGGIDAHVARSLELAAQSGTMPRAIVYVSCNPATLARDVSRLPSYRVEQLQPYDMFPQTAHVETVCLLVPER